MKPNKKVCSMLWYEFFKEGNFHFQIILCEKVHDLVHRTTGLPPTLSYLMHWLVSGAGCKAFKMVTKGQLISKANCQAVNSSKKRTTCFRSFFGAN